MVATVLGKESHLEIVLKYVYKMQNMTFGTDGGLTKACQEKHPTEPGLCFMSPHMQEFIETPFFSACSADCEPLAPVLL